MPFHLMTEGESSGFLRHPPRPALVSTTRADGRPHAAPVWYDLDGDTIVFITGVHTVKGRNLARDPRVTLCVQDDQPPYSFVSAEGTAELVDDLAEVRLWAGRIGGRYMGADQADEYGERNGVPGELLVRVTVHRRVAMSDLAD
ncbi:MAG: PPOX class F420-dependent oxidoreductase [Acidimicrobiales bacterium]